MTRQPIVAILGNSVPVLIQPFRKSADERTYIEHLRDHGFNVINGCKQSMMISDLYTNLEDDCIAHCPDYVVLNFGIVECTYRARPRWLHNYFAMNTWNNTIIRPRYNPPLVRGFKVAVKFLYRHVIERFAFAVGIKRRWLSPDDFQFILRDISRLIFRDTPARKIILLKMLPGQPWLERQAPGTLVSIDEFNAVTENVAKDNPNFVCLDPVSTMMQADSTQISSDGIHFTALGHQQLAQSLIPLLQGERTHYGDWVSIPLYDKFRRVYADRHQRK